MKKQQWILVGCSVALLLMLFIFGRTKPVPKPHTADDGHYHEAPAALTIETILQSAKQKLSPEQDARLTALEQSIVRGDLTTQKKQVYDQLISFWRDSVPVFEPYAWYLAERAKLENSEKNLTFAAHLMMTQCRGTSDPSVRTWLASVAKDLFERAAAINPANDSTQVGLGSTFFFGAGGQAAPMEGISKIRAVADRDSTNTYAQFMLGYGGILSGQYDKAVERLLKVVKLDPMNIEAVFLLAESLEKTGDKVEAANWYEHGMKFVSNPQARNEIATRVKELREGKK